MKALGHQLGRFVLVFNCDENFDFQVRIIGYLKVLFEHSSTTNYCLNDVLSIEINVVFISTLIRVLPSIHPRLKLECLTILSVSPSLGHLIPITRLQFQTFDFNEYLLPLVQFCVFSLVVTILQKET